MKLNKSVAYIVFLLAGLFLSSGLSAQIPLDNRKKAEPPTTRILFVFDCSQSMAGFWEHDKKINIARKFLIHTIDSLENVPHLQMALRVYGNRSVVPPQDCGDTHLEVPFSAGNAAKIRQELRYLVPKGTTPIARSLELTAGDFPPCDNCRNVVVLITDGIEACDGDPCAVSKTLQKEGIFLKPFIIGIGLDPDFKNTFNCVGRFYNAEEEKRFQDVLNVVVTEALNSTTAQVNLLDQNGDPTETNVNFTLYNTKSGKAMHNYVHTINNWGRPDTLTLDPLITYRMVVHTLPPVVVDGIKISRGKHNIIAAYTPQGTLLIQAGSSKYHDLKVIVRKNGEMKTINMQQVNEPEKYITGTYDLEIPVLPRIYVNGIEVKQSTTTKVQIPVPGIVNFLMSNPGYCSIYSWQGQELEWIYNIPSDLKHKTLILQPGTYMAVFRPRYAKRSFYTTSKTFIVTSGSSKSLKLF